MAKNIFPSFSVIDAAPAMEGKGPIRGIEKNLGIFLCSNDPVAVDAVCCNITGINLDYNQYIKNFGRLGLGIAKTDKIHLFNLQNLAHLDDEDKFKYHEWFQNCKFTPQEIELLKKYTL